MTLFVLCGPGMVADTLPRRSELTNPPVANIDQVSLNACQFKALALLWMHGKPLQLALSAQRLSLIDSLLQLKVLLVFSLDKPIWDGQMATRFLVSAEAANLATVVVLNKADLVSADARQEVVAQVGAWHMCTVIVRYALALH